MSDQKPTVTGSLQSILQISRLNLAKKSKMKAIRSMRDYAVQALQLHAGEQLKNSADLAAATKVAEEATKLLSNHAPAEVLEQFDKEYTQRLSNGELAAEIFAEVQKVLAEKASTDAN